MKLSVQVMLLLLAGQTAVAADEIYRFIDANGVVHFTNVPSGDHPYQRLGREHGCRPRPRRVHLRKRQLRRVSDRRIWKPYLSYMREASRRYNIPVALIKAVMAVESNLRPTALSPVGALGLMQLMPETVQLMKVSNPFEPRQSILGGTRFLRYLANRLDNDLVLTVAAYNAGLRAVLKYGGIPPFAETRRYVKRVVSLYDAFRAAGEPALVQEERLLANE